MTIDASKISWGSYSSFEGPVFWGSKAYSLPKDAGFEDKTLSIISATEGHLDSVNMYDVCIVTVGLIQWCERNQYSVSDMLGTVAEKKGLQYVLDVLKPALDLSNATFKKNGSNKWRFFLNRSGKEIEVNSSALQQECFLSCSGKKGDWTPTAKTHARTWCLAMANVWQDDEACTAQLDFTKKRLFAWYVTPNAKKILFGDDARIDGYAGALKSLIVSYAVNMPAVADRQLVIAVQNSKAEKWSKAWCLDIMNQIVFGSGIPIWLTRYNAIRPRLEEYFGIELPKNNKELQSKSWLSDPNSSKAVPVAKSQPEEVKEESVPVVVNEVPVQEKVEVQTPTTVTDQSAQQAPVQQPEVQKKSIISSPTNVIAMVVLAVGWIIATITHLSDCLK